VTYKPGDIVETTADDGTPRFGVFLGWTTSGEARVALYTANVPVDELRRYWPGLPPPGTPTTALSRCWRWGSRA
jgi:hypothetical protein